MFLISMDLAIRIGCCASAILVAGIYSSHMYMFTEPNILVTNTSLKLVCNTYDGLRFVIACCSGEVAAGNCKGVSCFEVEKNDPHTVLQNNKEQLLCGAVYLNWGRGCIG